MIVWVVAELRDDYHSVVISDVHRIWRPDMEGFAASIATLVACR
jgi:hypothetical protein